MPHVGCHGLRDVSESNSCGSDVEGILLPGNGKGLTQ